MKDLPCDYYRCVNRPSEDRLEKCLRGLLYSLWGFDGPCACRCHKGKCINLWWACERPPTHRVVFIIGGCLSHIDTCEVHAESMDPTVFFIGIPFHPPKGAA